MFINVYAPIEDKEDSEFYIMLLNDIMKKTLINSILVILDFNAKFGKRNFFRPITGTHTLHQVSNENE